MIKERIIGVNHLGQVKVQTEHIPGPLARLSETIAKNLVFGIIEPDGEDYARRQKFKNMDPKEIAKRACDIAAALVDEWQQRGWIIDVPESLLTAAHDEKPF